MIWKYANIFRYGWKWSSLLDQTCLSKSYISCILFSSDRKTIHRFGWPSNKDNNYVNLDTTGKSVLWAATDNVSQKLGHCNTSSENLGKFNLGNFTSNQLTIDQPRLTSCVSKIWQLLQNIVTSVARAPIHGSTKRCQTNTSQGKNKAQIKCKVAPGCPGF